MAYQSYVLVCGGTACCSSGGDKVVAEFKRILAEQKLDETVQVVTTGCLGFCEQGPIVKILPQGTFYVQVKPEDVKEIVADVCATTPSRRRSSSPRRTSRSTRSSTASCCATAA